MGYSNGSFELKTGNKLVVPEGVNIQFSRNRAEHPDTPCIMRVFRTRDGNFFFFDPGDLTVMKSYGVFVPDGVKPGDELIVDWVEDNSARAVYPKA